MDYPIVEDGYYFIIVYEKLKRPIDGEIQIGRYNKGLWELMGTDEGLPMDSLISIIGERIYLPTMRMG